MERRIGAYAASIGGLGGDIKPKGAQPGRGPTVLPGISLIFQAQPSREGLATRRVHPYDDLCDPVKMQAVPVKGPEPVRIPLFNPRSSGLFPAISTVEDGEMWGSAVSRDRVRGVRGCLEELEKLSGKARPWHLAGETHIGQG
jgi:hypothetical protein